VKQSRARYGLFWRVFQKTYCFSGIVRYYLHCKRKAISVVFTSFCLPERIADRATGRALKNIDRENRFDTYKTSSNVACCNQRIKYSCVGRKTSSFSSIKAWEKKLTLGLV